MPELKPKELFDEIKGNLYDISKVASIYVLTAGALVSAIGVDIDNKPLVLIGGYVSLFGAGYKVATMAAERHYRRMFNSNNNPASDLENETTLSPVDTDTLERITE